MGAGMTSGVNLWHFLRLSVVAMLVVVRGVSAQRVDIPIITDTTSFFPRLPELFDAVAGSSRFHSLRAVAISPIDDDIIWVTEPCDDSDPLALPCQSSLSSVRALSQVLSDPSCGGTGGLSFSLDPEDPKAPLGGYFVKSFHPAACADLWSDLLPGQVMLEADFDLKLLLHNVSGIGEGLGDWYMTIEDLSREDPPLMDQEHIARVWVSATTVETRGSRYGMAFHDVGLRLDAAAAKRDLASPTGLADAGPATGALKRFIDAANAHMDELIAHLPSFRYLQQLVVALEAAKFLKQTGLPAPPDPGLCSMVSPLTGRTRVPAIKVERNRDLGLSGVVKVGSWEEGLLRRVAGDRNDTLWLEGQRPRIFRCHVVNGTTAAFKNFDALFEEGRMALDCEEEVRVEDDVDDVVMDFDTSPDDGPVTDPCPDALTVHSHGGKTLSLQSKWVPGLTPVYYNVSATLVGQDGVCVEGTVVVVSDMEQLREECEMGQVPAGVILLPVLLDPLAMVEEMNGWFDRPSFPVRVLEYFEGPELVALMEQGTRLTLDMLCKSPGEETKPSEPDDGSIGPPVVRYKGSVYTTLDRARPMSQRKGCQDEPIELPEGYELVPAYKDIIKYVVKPYPWGSDALILLDVSANGVIIYPPSIHTYTTAHAHGKAGQKVSPVDIIMDRINGSHVMLQPATCDCRILIRTVKTTVRYQGHVYRVLDEGVPVDSFDTDVTLSLSSRRRELPTEPPEGWELAPVNRGVAQRVVGAHPWGADYLVLAGGSEYPTLMGGSGSQRRVLIRRLEHRNDTDESSRRNNILDTYQTEATATLVMERLPQGVGYLLRMDVKETVLVHGGVDLTTVQRVTPPQEAAYGDDVLLSALEREVQAGRVTTGRRQLSEGPMGNRTYDVQTARWRARSWREELGRRSAVGFGMFEQTGGVLPSLNIFAS